PIFFTIRKIRPGSHAVVFDRLMELRTGHVQPPVDLIDLGLSETGIPGALLATRLLDAGGFSMTSGVSFPFAADREAAIMTYLREKEPGFGRRRLDLPEDYSLFFYRLHRRVRIMVGYEAPRH